MGGGWGTESDREARQSERDKGDIKTEKEKQREQGKDWKEGGEGAGGRGEGIKDLLPFSEQSPSRGTKEQDGLLRQLGQEHKTTGPLAPCVAPSWARHGERLVGFRASSPQRPGGADWRPGLCSGDGQSAGSHSPFPELRFRHL